jgi:sensor c-di-GMP phosphodiesterase-like protein
LLTGLVRFLISLVMLAAFVWFAVTVPLGKRTLWGHVHAIFGTQEAKDLAEGTKEEAERVARKVKEELRPQDMAQSAPSTPRRVKTPLR